MKTQNSITAILLLLSVFQINYSQSIESVSKQQNKKLIKIVRANGWETPNIKNAKPITERTIEINDMSVVGRTYKLRNKKISLPIESYYLKAEDSLSISESSYQCELDNAVAYSVKNKIFAYKLSCVLFSIQAVTITRKITKDKKYETQTWSSKRYAGAMISYFYFDEDGDGKFETKYDTYEMPSEIPGWIKNL